MCARSRTNINFSCAKKGVIIRNRINTTRDIIHRGFRRPKTINIYMDVFRFMNSRCTRAGGGRKPFHPVSTRFEIQITKFSFLILRWMHLPVSGNTRMHMHTFYINTHSHVYTYTLTRSRYYVRPCSVEKSMSKNVQKNFLMQKWREKFFEN